MSLKDVVVSFVTDGRRRQLWVEVRNDSKYVDTMRSRARRLGLQIR